MLLGLGVEDALMLDGGGSTQGIFPRAKVTSTRKVPTLLLFWERDKEPEGGKPMVEINAYSKAEGRHEEAVRQFQSQRVCLQGWL